ncbi:triose-phosphate isomerase [Prolixibacter denitrificans]|uniref:Triosephosphate isomerase n=1 Tax=Prolixibacter denitrificans TaxID=1541063 RepID=A0A2P8CFX3_9BACT|nr:triose-phosphate isomerase [Prolixibacter denitrificans]PSK83893.1 triosephosphate isomerase [Prolixibacter denitrificans]GET23435.1 triosephosphate isomerase [Prolixibacter denitrificans]
MRKKIVAGNWKCNTTLQEGVELAKAVNELVVSKGDKDVVVVLGTPFTHLTKVVESVDASRVGVSAQNCAAEAKGAFTGEVSAEMVKSTGATYVILGHSERREYYNETSEILNKKVALTLENGLTPIYCCGEPLEIREAETQNDFVKKQLDETVFQLPVDEFKKLVIAYEPIWAIGTGKTASTEQAQDMLAFIRSLIADKFGKDIAEEISILYGGSCKASNAPELFSQPDIDGGLIGGASLKAEEFLGIINAY